VITLSILCNNNPESERKISLNFELFAGKWTIEVAIKSKCPDRYAVSTEDKEAARITRGYVTEDIHRRCELATDKHARVRFLRKLRYPYLSKTANSKHRNALSI
jgi:CMP-N-acetylneuraminic acid synthetase